MPSESEGPPTPPNRPSTPGEFSDTNRTAPDGALRTPLREALAKGRGIHLGATLAHQGDGLLGGCVTVLAIDDLVGGEVDPRVSPAATPPMITTLMLAPHAGPLLVGWGI